MLNEIAEYNKYLDPKTNYNNSLLKAFSKKGEISGIGRPFTVLARGFLDKCRANKLSEEEAIALFSVFIKAWCELDVEIPECNNAIKTEILKAQNAPITLNLKDQKIDKFRKKIRRDYSPNGDFFKSVMYSKIEGIKTASDNRKARYSSKNDYNKWYFSRIITEAYKYGSLRDEVLAVKLPNGKDFGLTKGGNEVSLKKKTSDLFKVLCIVTEYLRGQVVDGDSEYVSIVKAEISNWCRGQDGEYINEAFSIEYKGENLITKYNFDNSIVIKVNKNWLTDYDVRLAPAIEAEELKKLGYLVFKDEFTSNSCIFKTINN